MQQPIILALSFAALLPVVTAQNTTAPEGTAVPTAPATSTGVTINALTGQQIQVPTDQVPAQPSLPPAVRTAPAAALRPLTNAATGSRSSITPIQLQNINRLVLDLNALALPTRDRAEQERALRETLLAAPISAVRPSEEAIGQLSTTVVTVLPSLNLTAPQRRQLAIDLNLALNSGNLGPTETQRVLADLQNVLRGSAAANPERVNLLMDTVRGMVAGVQRDTAGGAPPPVSSPAPVGQSSGTVSGQGGGASQGAVQPQPSP